MATCRAEIFFKVASAFKSSPIGDFRDLLAALVPETYALFKTTVQKILKIISWCF
jgi:hypothetical protein